MVKKRVTRQSVERTNLDVCLFCQRKYKRKKNNCESLKQCQTFEAGAKIYEAALVRNDQRVLLQVQDGTIDCVAAELRYHFTCYRDFVTLPRRATGLEATIYQEAFVSLAARVEAGLANTAELNAMDMGELTKWYNEKLSELSGKEHQYRTSLLKWRLRSHFGDKIMFVRSSVTESESLVAKDLDDSVVSCMIGKAVSASKRKSREADESDDSSTDDSSDECAFLPAGVDVTEHTSTTDLFHVAMKLRADVQAACHHLPNVPDLAQCTSTAALAWIPDSLYNFLV